LHPRNRAAIINAVSPRTVHERVTTRSAICHALGDLPSMNYSVTEAARAVGRSKATIIRAIASGTLSAERDEPGKPWRIDPAELTRAFPEPVHEPAREPDHDASRTDVIREKDALITAHEATIADLRHRLDQEATDRRQALDRLAIAQERIAALLTDQRPTLPAPARRGWWSWRRARIGA
jgi:excisionase family DNA binding protein